jgi:uncharacterized membrane protein YfcA
LFVGIGLTAGFFSALFGVGVLAGFAPRTATGTSLAAIGLTALFGVVAFASLGEVEWDDAATVGLPAVAGTFLGTWLQERVSSRLLVLCFAGFLIAIAVELFLR